MKPLTELDLLWHKDPLTVEDAATLLFGKSRSSAVEGVVKAAIEAGKLRAEVVRWPVYYADMGTEIDDGSGNINQHETTIRMEDFKAYRQSIGAGAGKETVPVEQAEAAQPYSTAWLTIQQNTIAQFFNPRRNPDAKKEEVVEWIKQQAERAGLPDSNNTATSIFTIIKPANHDPKKKRVEPQ